MQVTKWQRGNWRQAIRQGKKESPAWLERAERMRRGEIPSALDVLEERGLVKEIAGDRSELRKRFIDQRVSIYSGIDPTAQSLHLGHLIPLNTLFWLFSCGHTCCSLLGSFTARIGDPTDRLQARTTVQKKEHDQMANQLKDQLKSVWKHVDGVLASRGQVHGRDEYGFREDLGPQRSIEENTTWLRTLTLWEYLKTAGRCGKMGAMLSRDSVKNRLERGDSMTLAEFNYPLLQAYDFFHLFASRGVQVQVGGSDQYGNIVAGMDFIDYMQKNHPEECAIGSGIVGQKSMKPYGITTPLLTTASGDKFGKSAGNAVWLDPKLTSPFELYGYLLKTSDDDVERFLKLLTVVKSDIIKTVMAEHQVDPSKRRAQHLLAYEICIVAHGLESAEQTAKLHQQSRAPSLSNFSSGNHHDAGTSTKAKTEDRRVGLPRSVVERCSLAQLLVLAGVAESNSKAQNLRRAGGLYVARTTGESSDELEFHQVDKQPQTTVRVLDWVVDERLLVLRSGKWKTFVIEVIEDEDFDRRDLSVRNIEDWRGWLEGISPRPGITGTEKVKGAE